jgi:hypothetical protein
MEDQTNFGFFITSLAMQASIALGFLPNPVTQKSEENLDHAKLIIDTMGMLKEKTQGNLNAEEDSLIDNFLYELRTQYLAKVKEKGPEEGPEKGPAEESEEGEGTETGGDKESR